MCLGLGRVKDRMDRGRSVITGVPSSTGRLSSGSTAARCTDLGQAVCPESRSSDRQSVPRRAADKPRGASLFHRHRVSNTTDTQGKRNHGLVHFSRLSCSVWSCDLSGRLPVLSVFIERSFLIFLHRTSASQRALIEA